MVQRELRVGLLRRKARQQWLRATWIAGGISLFFLVFMAVSSNSSSGRLLFRYLFGVAIVGVVTRGFGLTADLFSEERRNGTLGLLVLTGLTPLEIFANKLFGAAILTSYGLLGSLPFFALPFLAGGVSAVQFLCALVFLANALLFCVAIGLLASVIHRDGGQAQITAVAIAALLSLAAPVAWWISTAILGRATASYTWLVTSPIYPGFLSFTNFAGGSRGLFWDGSGITLCYSLVALLLAAGILQRTWHDAPEAETRGKLWKRWQAWGKSDSRCRLRLRLLAQNPFAWLAARNRGPALLAQTLAAFVAIAYAGLFFIVGWNWLTVGNALVASLVVHLGLNWIVDYAAGKSFGEERQSGGFEVLLTTPLRPREIVEGQHKGLIAQFKTTWCMVIAFDLLIAGSNFLRFTWNNTLIIIYLVMWAVLLLFWFSVHLETASRAMWISAWTGRPGYSAIQAMRPYFWSVFWIAFLCQGTFRSRQGLYPGSMLMLALVAPILTLAVFGSRGTLRDKLTRELRDIAAAPIPARDDKRFKNWDSKRIFPPGRWGYFELRAADSTRSRRIN